MGLMLIFALTLALMVAAYRFGMAVSAFVRFMRFLESD